MRAERRAKRVKSREEGEDALATADGLVGCTGEKNSQQGVKLPPRMHLVRQMCKILGHTVWVERVCYCFGTVGNAVRVFLLPVKQQNSYVAACLSLPSYTCTSSASKFTTCPQQNVNIVYHIISYHYCVIIIIMSCVIIIICCLGLQRCKAVSLHNH